MKTPARSVPELGKPRNQITPAKTAHLRIQIVAATLIILVLVFLGAILWRPAFVVPLLIGICAVLRKLAK